MYFCADNPISRLEVLATFSLLFFFSSFCILKHGMGKGYLCSMPEKKKKQISNSHFSCRLDIKNLWKMLSPVDNNRNCRSLVFVIFKDWFEREFQKSTEAEILMHWYQLEVCLQFQESWGFHLWRSAVLNYSICDGSCLDAGSVALLEVLAA